MVLNQINFFFEFLMISPKPDPPPYVFRDEGNDIPLQPNPPNFIIMPYYSAPPQPPLTRSDSKGLFSIVCCFASTFLVFMIFLKIMYTLGPA